MKTLRLALCCLLLPILLPAFHARGESPDAQAMSADVDRPPDRILRVFTATR